ncbi:MAG: VWA domain-containing protein [Muribaculaceae bacterium]|nr:VWA domain-containing protein [Bacteroides sp.]MDE6071808.1 VWA domain-containing protein [Muribaculaceae bacterium]
MMLKHPYILLLFLLYVPLIAWYIWKWRNSNPAIGVSSVRAFRKVRNSWKVYLMHFCFALQLIAIGGIIVALARPQTHDSHSTSRVEGTDIVLAMDISSSMLATDLKPTRFDVAKEVAQKFVNQRTDDNIGLVVFSGETLSLMPLTNDKPALINAISAIKTGMLNDGTAIGDGLSSAVNRLTSGKAKSKSIILLTDGTNNAGDVAPSTAAQIAKEKGIKIYTIGVGTNGSIQITDPYGFSTTTMETKIDESALKQIASLTNGKYFRATDAKMLRDIFEEINALEKTTLDVNRIVQTEENFMPWIVLALCALGLQLLLRYTILRRIP